MSKKKTLTSKDFRINCVFEMQLRYEHIVDNYYLVPMESGKNAVYKREIDDHRYYGGTGQHDYKFTFEYYERK